MSNAHSDWFYFVDEEGVRYATFQQKAVWQLADNDVWTQIPATFTQLARFCPYLRDSTADERQRLPPPKTP